MVRQQSDPLGATTGTRAPIPVKMGRDPDAEIVRSSSEIIGNNKSSAELQNRQVVADPIETRHVVDEIREDANELDSTKREDSLDVIDWC